MSLPNYLSNIKSSGIYRFTWDKSIVPPVEAPTLRLVVGYSEKGPFNTPVYIDSAADFTEIFGRVSKRLERKGVFFHRMALQALTAGPILALNLKKFNSEEVETINFDAKTSVENQPKSVKTIYDTSKFWKLDADLLPEKITGEKYIYLTATDTKDASCSYFMRKAKDVKGYDLTIRQWYANQPDLEIPEYLNNDAILDTKLNDYFAEIYVFKGKFTESLCTGNGTLAKYFAGGKWLFSSNNPSYAGTDMAYGLSTANSTKLVVDTNSAVFRAKDDTDSTLTVKAMASKYSTSSATLDLASPVISDTIDGEISATYNDCFTISPTTIKQSSAKALATTVAEGVNSNNINIIEKAFTVKLAAPANSKIKKDITVYLVFTNGKSKVSFPIDVKVKTKKELVESKELALNPVYKDAFGQEVDALKALAEDANSNFINAYKGCLLPYFKNGNGYYESLDIVFNKDYDAHKMLMKLDEAILTTDNVITSMVPGSDWQYATTPNYLLGYNYQTITSTTSLEDYQNNTYGILADSTYGVREALTNNVDIQYHYIIDTFKGLLEGGKYKVYLSSLAKAKDNCLAILNYPAIKDLDGVIKSNGKLDEATLKLKFSLPIENEGASYCAFYTPVVLSDGTVKTTCPSAALVSNNYMEKYASRQPYYIVAGSNYGRLSAAGLVGPDYNFGRGDLDVLEPMGVNAIVYVPRKGTFINSNQTAKQTPVTALSKINVRELVIYLQDEIESMLQNYQWELNTQTLRGTVKAKADTILENVKNNGGVYAYVNVCDETNNTPEVIDNEMIILDTAIEPARGAGKMVQQITIHKTGALSSVTK